MHNFSRQRGIIAINADASEHQAGAILAELQGSFADFRDRHVARLSGVERAVDEQAAALAALRLNGGAGQASGGGPAPVTIALDNGRQATIFPRASSVGQHFRPASGDEVFDLTDFCMANIGLRPRAEVTRGPATVGVTIGGQIIDAVRAASRVVQAGASTIAIEGPTNLARIEGDPTVFEHAEGVSDVSESDLTLGAVTMNPAALVALVPLSAEIVADSANIGDALTLSLGGAFARKLDDLAIAGILADATVPTNSVGRATDSWLTTVAAVGDALAVDQDVPAALIGNATDFAARASELASTSGAWLGRPPVLADMLDLPTTALSAGTAIFGDFARGIAMVARLELTLEMLRFAKPGAYTHTLLAHARIAPVLLQPARLFAQQATI